MEDANIKHLAGGNIDIDLTTPSDQIAWKQNACPWNTAEKTGIHRCAVKNTSICRYFCGIDYPDVVKCCYPDENPLDKD